MADIFDGSVWILEFNAIRDDSDICVVLMMWLEIAISNNRGDYL